MNGKDINPVLMELPMPITTPRLILRPPQVGDGVVVNEAVLESFNELVQFMPWAKERPSLDDTEIFVRTAAANWILKKAEEPYLPLFMFDRVTNRFVGATGYHHYDWEVPYIEIGYWIRTGSSGQGLMTEAVNALTQYAFKELCVKRITITCDINNVRSRRIPETLGYHLESVAKLNRVDYQGKISDTLVFVKHDLSDLSEMTVVW